VIIPSGLIYSRSVAHLGAVSKGAGALQKLPLVVKATFAIVEKKEGGKLAFSSFLLRTRNNGS